MPIKFETTGSIREVEQEIRSLEIQYGMTSEDFVALSSVDDVVPEFDAIEWSLLLTQKRAAEEDSCGPTVFQANCETEIGPVDVSDKYYQIAA